MTKDIYENNYDIIDREEAAKMLCVSASTIERLKRKGKLLSIKIAPKCVRYRRSDCESFLESCTIHSMRKFKN